MTQKAAVLRPSRPVRLGIAIFCVFSAQVALLFWLSDRSPLKVRASRPAPAVRSTTSTNSFLLVEDPTLFVLPHDKSFSGQAWLQMTNHDFQTEEDVESPRLLVLRREELGVSFAKFIQTNTAPGFEAGYSPRPELTAPPIPVSTPIVLPSVVRIEGELAKRRLLSKFELPAWQSTELLTNSVIQVLVDGVGNTLSAVLLTSSGNTNADPYALQLAKNARFEPAQKAGPERSSTDRAGLMTGKLIFQWQTLPPSNGTAPTTGVQ